MFSGKIIVSDTEDGVEKLRADDTFVEDEGRHARFRLYADFLDRHRHARTLFMDPGIGMNTPALCAMRSKKKEIYEKCDKTADFRGFANFNP